MKHIKLGSLFCTALMMVALLPPLVQAADTSEALSLLNVSGESQLSVPADFASFSIGVQNSATQAQVALKQNSQLMQQLKQALIGAGVAEDELSSGPFSVQPQWLGRPRNADASWQPTIVGYQARAQLLVETAQLDKVADYIQAGVDAGANQIGQLRFSLRDNEAVYQRALTQATELARRRAGVAANAAGVKLGDLHRINVDPQRGRPFQPNRVTSMARMATESAVPVVVPGNIDVHATVQLSYRLR